MVAAPPPLLLPALPRVLLHLLIPNGRSLHNFSKVTTKPNAYLKPLPVYHFSQSSFTVTIVGPKSFSLQSRKPSTLNLLCAAYSSSVAASSGSNYSLVSERNGVRGVVKAKQGKSAQRGEIRRSSSISDVKMVHFTTEPRHFQIVVAATEDCNGIGVDGKLPWKIPEDMIFFRDLTTTTESKEKHNAVVMGRKTWESLPPSFRPLPGRVNVVLSHQAGVNINRLVQGSGNSVLNNNGFKDVHFCGSLDAALSLLSSRELSQSIERVFVIGGGQIYSEALKSTLCEAIHITNVGGCTAQCDTFLPPIDPSTFILWCSSTPKSSAGNKQLRYTFTSYIRRPETHVGQTGNSASANGADGSKGEEDYHNEGREAAWRPECLPPAILCRHDEFQYLHIIKDIINNGAEKGDRTGTGTVSKFGFQMRFNLRKSFPLLTTKRVFWRGVAEELLWFISGCTNAKVLEQKGVHIWDANASRSYLDSIGLNEHEEGDLGPVYGFQWRHFGAKYRGMHVDYRGEGIDQLQDAISKIRNKPNDRRIVISAWNPCDLSEMALPPCHLMAQFYVANGELSCQMYQRSCDMGLGVPFNIASYALLTCLIAHVTGLKRGELVHVLGDAHVYMNHVEPLKEQLKNLPRPFPELRIKGNMTDIDAITMEDIELVDYFPQKKIAMQMAI